MLLVAIVNHYYFYGCLAALIDYFNESEEGSPYSSLIRVGNQVH